MDPCFPQGRQKQHSGFVFAAGYFSLIVSRAAATTSGGSA
jgi:hypothetical protein